MSKLLLIFPILLAVQLFILSEDKSLSEDVVVLEKKLAQLNAKLSKTESGVPLMPTIDNWMRLKSLAESKGATLTWDKEYVYEGRHHHYTGWLAGDVKITSALIGKLHKDLPILIHSVNIRDQVAQFHLSVLGVDL